MSEIKKFDVKKFLINYNTYIVLLIMFIVSSFMSEHFLTAMNLRNIGLQQVAPVLVALGMLFVILIGGIDLSVGSIMAFGSSFSAVLMANTGIHFIPAIILAGLLGMGFGVVTGILVAFGRMQGFVASLAMMTIARGCAFLLTGGQPIRVELGTLDLIVSREHFFPGLIATGIIILILVFVHRYTVYGRIVTAIGSNEQAVDLAGIRVRRYTVSVYALSGLMAALAGTYIAARASTGSATIGVGQELNAIAACVIGGASLAGGRGFVLRTVAGALILALIGNIMNLLAVPPYPQQIIQGLIIIIAVLLQIYTSKTEKSV